MDTTNLLYDLPLCL